MARQCGQPCAHPAWTRLRADQGVPEGERKRIVRRWFVLTLLTGRSTGSFETVWELDIRRIAQQGAASYLLDLMGISAETVLAECMYSIQHASRNARQ